MPPFYAKDREKLFKSIKAGSVKFPKYLSKEAVSLLEGLFIKDPDSRLGSGDNGVEMIKNHPFFLVLIGMLFMIKKLSLLLLRKLKMNMILDILIQNSLLVLLKILLMLVKV